MTTLENPKDLADLIRRLRTVRADSTARWGRMSAHQMICHCADALRMATGELTVSEATGPLQRTLIKWSALYLPLRWPPGFPTRPEIDQHRGRGTQPTAFASDVDDVAARLAFVATHHVTCKAHPIFGPLSQRAWRRWAYLHTDHHLRQFGA